MTDEGQVSGRSRSPLARAIQEVFVVALGILVAFGIDAWWDRAQERRASEQLLDAVVAELEVNADRLSNVSERYEAITDAGFGLLQLTGPNPREGVTSEGLRLVTRYWRSGGTDLVSSALDAALQSGAFGTLPDDSLRILLVNRGASSAGEQLHCRLERSVSGLGL